MQIPLPDGTYYSIEYRNEESWDPVWNSKYNVDPRGPTSSVLSPPNPKGLIIYRTDPKNVAKVGPHDFSSIRIPLIVTPQSSFVDPINGVTIQMLRTENGNAVVNLTLVSPNGDDGFLRSLRCKPVWNESLKHWHCPVE